jgi:release factor glutamine methyltransferase
MITGTFTVGIALEWGREMLSKHGLEDGDMESRAILSGHLNLKPTELYLNQEKVMSDDAVMEFQRMIARRAHREPVAYILGRQNFMGREFVVTPDVLIPRPETEELVEHAISILIKGKTNGKILDIGTGSGCIAISLALEFPGADVLAVDVSDTALKVAERNTERLKVANIRLQKSNLFGALASELQGDFDMIISNPPYISPSEMAGLDADVGFEPRIALDGGFDGLAIIRKIVAGAFLSLKRRGVLMMEIGHDQGDSVRKLLAETGFINVQVIKDVNGLDRIIRGELSGSV